MRVVRQPSDSESVLRKFLVFGKSVDVQHSRVTQYGKWKSSRRIDVNMEELQRRFKNVVEWNIKDVWYMDLYVCGVWV